MPTSCRFSANLLSFYIQTKAAAQSGITRRDSTLKNAGKTVQFFRTISKQRDGKIVARPLGWEPEETLAGFVLETVQSGETVYTDDHRAYRNLRHTFRHEAVKHSAAEYVRGDVHTNSIESFWAMLKRGHKGTFHKISRKHLHRYVNEFAGRHNIRGLDTLDQMAAIVRGMDQKRLRYADLIA